MNRAFGFLAWDKKPMMMILNYSLFSNGQSYPPHYLLQQKISPHINSMARLYVTSPGTKGIMSSGNRWYMCCMCFFSCSFFTWKSWYSWFFTAWLLVTYWPTTPFRNQHWFLAAQPKENLGSEKENHKGVAVPEDKEMKKQPEIVGSSTSVWLGCQKYMAWQNTKDIVYLIYHNHLQVKLLTHSQPGPLSGRDKVTMNNPISRQIPTIGGVSHPLEVSPLSVNYRGKGKDWAQTGC